VARLADELGGVRVLALGVGRGVDRAELLKVGSWRGERCLAGGLAGCLAGAGAVGVGCMGCWEAGCWWAGQGWQDEQGEGLCRQPGGWHKAGRCGLAASASSSRAARLLQQCTPAHSGTPADPPPPAAAPAAAGGGPGRARRAVRALPRPPRQGRGALVAVRRRLRGRRPAGCALAAGQRGQGRRRRGRGARLVFWCKKGALVACWRPGWLTRASGAARGQGMQGGAPCLRGW
jgi:hypothetical protein